MTRERLSLYDTTLRDGAQTHGVDFSVEDKWLIAQQLDALGIDYIEGGYPGANPTDTRLFAEARELGQRAAHRVRHDQAARPLARQRSRLPGAARRQHLGHLPGRQDLGLPCRCRARHHARRECRGHQRLGRGGRGERPRGSARLRAFLRRLQGQSRLRAALRQDGLRGRRALGRAVRHQWRHAA